MDHNPKKDGRGARFSPEEHEAFRRRIGGGASLGKELIRVYHPTGLFNSTEPAVISMSADRRSMKVGLKVHWRGSLTNSPYITEFSFSVSKNGFERLIVERDNFPSAEAHQQAERFLRNYFEKISKVNNDCTLEQP